MLNAKNRITDDFGKMYQNILADYRTLRKTSAMRDREFAQNPVYTNEFKPVYQSIMRTAEIYLDGDNNTKNIKNIAKIMFLYNDRHNAKADSAQNENALQTLHSVKFPQGGAAEDIAELNTLISKIENQQYTQVFAAKIDKLKNMQPSPAATEYSERLKDDVNSTYCRICRTEADSAIAAYTRRLELSNQQAAHAKLAHNIDLARDRIFYILQREEAINTYFKEKYPDTMPADAQFLYEDFEKLRQNREKLQNAIKADYENAKTSVIESAADDIESASTELGKLLDALCAKNSELCQ